MKRKFSPPHQSSLSVIIPAYNAERWIEPTLKHLWESLRKTQWRSIEVLVIDDGSKDKTAEAASKIRIGTKVTTIRQVNSGRLKTRKNGIQQAKGEYVLMLDSRVYTKPDSLKFLVDQMNKTPEAVVWNGHVEVERKGNPFARFWYAITFIAWRRYMRKPRTLSYGVEDFDYYPKGAGCFFAPREYLLDAYEHFTTYYKDDRNSNDDTSLIRNIAAKSRIYISPGFAFSYNSRSTLKAFIVHTMHRGVVFVDGYFRHGSRYFWPCLLYLLLIPAAVAIAVFNPILILVTIPILILIFMFAKILGTETADAAALAYVMPVFALFYTIGLYNGVFLRLKNTF